MIISTWLLFQRQNKLTHTHTHTKKAVDAIRMILSLESNSARCFSKEAYRPGLTSCSMFSGCWGDARPIFQSFFVTLWGNLGRFLVSTSLAFHPKDCWGLSTRIKRVHLHMKIRAYFGGLSWEVLWISDVLDASLLDYFEIWPPVLNLMGGFATSPPPIKFSQFAEILKDYTTREVELSSSL